MKKDKATKSQKKHIGEATVRLRHDFTDKEYRELGSRLAATNNEIAKLEHELKTLSSDYKARISQQEGQRDELSIKVGNQHELRETKVRVLFDPKAGKKTYFALDDTKMKKPLGEADMMPSDYEPELPVVKDVPKGDKPADGKPANVVPMPTGTAVAPGQPLNPVAAAVETAEAEAEKRYADAIEVVRSESKASVSLIQRRLKIGYVSAVAIIERMEREGVVGKANGSEPRAILNLPDPQPAGTPAHDTANPPPVPEKRKVTKRKPTKAEFAEQMAARGEGDK